MNAAEGVVPAKGDGVITALEWYARGGLGYSWPVDGTIRAIGMPGTLRVPALRGGRGVVGNILKFRKVERMIQISAQCLVIRRLSEVMQR